MTRAVASRGNGKAKAARVTVAKPASKPKTNGKPKVVAKPAPKAAEPEVEEAVEKKTKLESTREALQRSVKAISKRVTTVQGWNAAIEKSEDHELTEDQTDLVSEADAALSKGMEQIKEGIDFLNELEADIDLPAPVRIVPTFKVGAKVVIKKSAVKHYEDVLDGCEPNLEVKKLATDGKHFIGTMSDGGRAKVKLIHVQATK